MLKNMDVYLVQHLHVINENEEDVKIIGIYSSEENAIDAINRLKTQPGFKDSPEIINPLTDNKTDGFYIDKYKVDEDNWIEGFVTVLTV